MMGPLRHWLCFPFTLRARDMDPLSAVIRFAINQAAQAPVRSCLSVHSGEPHPRGLLDIDALDLRYFDPVGFGECCARARRVA